MKANDIVLVGEDGTKHTFKELRDYLVANIDDYESECDIAWRNIGKYHLYSVEQCHPQLYDSMVDAVEWFCEENGIDLESIDDLELEAFM